MVKRLNDGVLEEHRGLSYMLIILLAFLLLCTSAYPVQADSHMAINVSICGREYNLKAVSNSTILSIGNIPEGLKIITNESPAEILLHLSNELYVSNVRGNVLDYKLAEINGSESKILKIVVPRVNGLAEVEIVFKSPCLRIVPVKAISLGLTLLIVAIVSILLFKRL